MELSKHKDALQNLVAHRWRVIDAGLNFICLSEIGEAIGASDTIVGAIEDAMRLRKQILETMKCNNCSHFHAYGVECGAPDCGCCVGNTAYNACSRYTFNL